MALNVQSSLLVGVALLVGCGGGALPQHETSGPTMGTTYSVKIVAPPATFDTAAIDRQVADGLVSVDTMLSTYSENSALSVFNASRSTEWQDTTGEFCAVIEAALAMSEYTGGAFDVTVGPLVNLWGFGPDGVVLEPPDRHKIDALVSTVGYKHLQADCTSPRIRKTIPELYVDLSGYAKGYGVDRIAALLDAQGLENYLIEIGGEMRMRGINSLGEKWTIAVEKPMPGQRSVQSIVGLSGTALATSGDYRNYFEHDGKLYSHTIDPETGEPVTHNAASVTVISSDAATADALATALLVMGPEAGLEFAERKRIAAYFLLRTDDGIDELTSTMFAAEMGQ